MVLRSQLPQRLQTDAAGLDGHGDTRQLRDDQLAPGLAHPCRGNGSPPVGTLPRTYALVSSGGYHTCGLTLNGVAYCWGDNTAWQLGTGGDKSTRGTPTPVAGGLHFANLRAGGFQTCALTAAGAAYCWGGGRDSVPT